ITRLRVEVRDKELVDVEKLKQLGESGVLEGGNNMPAIFGPKPEQIQHEMQQMTDGKITSPAEITVTEDGDVETAEIVAEGG
ncbi:PTS glucose transporter subunit IICBA, partial [Staphylococcus condimenti]